MNASSNFYWPVLLLSNLIVLVLFYFAWKKPYVAKLGFCLLFAYAGLANWMMTIHTFSLFSSDANITYSILDSGPMHHWFSSHSETAIRSIAAWQWFIAITLLLRGWILRAGALLATVTLLVIAPIGFGSPFPFTFFAAMAMYLLSRPHKQVKSDVAVEE